MTINERMFTIMNQRNIKPKLLADKLNVGQNVISTWKKRGTTPPTEYTLQICELLDVSVYFYLTGENKELEELTQEEAKLLKDFNHCNRVIKDIILDSAARGAGASGQENLSSSKIG